MFELITIGSSSNGNSYLLKTSTESLIVECGMQYKKTLEALEFNLKNVAGCLVSHEHDDHSHSVKDLIKAGVNIYTSPGTLIALNVKSHRAKKVEPLKQFKTGGFTILPFETQHDAVQPLGFLIQHEEIGKLLFATDTFYIRYKFNGINYLMVECNYSKAIIDQRLREGTIEKFQVNRLLKSHFSLERVKEFLKANDLTYLQKIYLLHLSNKNSNADLFKDEIQKLTGIPVEIC